MQYFYNKDKNSTVAHIWVDGDTACKMLSTGGIKKGKKKVQLQLDNRGVCKMCQTNFAKILPVPHL